MRLPFSFFFIFFYEPFWFQKIDALIFLSLPAIWKCIFPFLSHTSVFCSPSFPPLCKKVKPTQRQHSVACSPALPARQWDTKVRAPRRVCAIVSSHCNHPWYLNPHDLLKDGLHCERRIDSVCANCQRAILQGEPQGEGGTLSGNYVRYEGGNGINWATGRAQKVDAMVVRHLPS